MKITIRMHLQHYLNGIRVRIFFQRFVSKERAKKIAMVYEQIVHPLLYK